MGVLLLGVLIVVSGGAWYVGQPGWGGGAIIATGAVVFFLILFGHY